jgi:hypothetical protein
MLVPVTIRIVCNLVRHTSANRSRPSCLTWPAIILKPIVMSDNEPPRDERHGNRQRVLKSATVSFSGGHSTMTCAARNFSATGARLRFDTPKGPPDTFALKIDLDGLAVDCEVTWRRGTEVGVRFLSEPRATTPARKQVIVSSGMPNAKLTLRRPPHGN